MKNSKITKWLAKRVLGLVLIALILSDLPLSVHAVTGDGILAPDTATAAEQVKFGLRTTDGGRSYRLTALDAYLATGIKSVIVEIPNQSSFQATIPDGWVTESQESDPIKSFVIQNGATKAEVLAFLKSVVLTSQTANELTGNVRVGIYTQKVAARTEAGNRHYYLVSEISKTWLEAYNAAITSNPDGGATGFQGLTGHLATITSPAEQNLTHLSLNAYGYWLGGTRLRMTTGDYKLGSPETINTDGTLKSTAITTYKTTKAPDTDSWYWATSIDGLADFYATPVKSLTGNITGKFHYFNSPYSSYREINGKKYATDFEAEGSSKHSSVEPNGNGDSSSYNEYCLVRDYEGTWNDLANDSNNYSLIEYEETASSKVVDGANESTVTITTPADTTNISSFANKVSFPLAAGSTRLILTKMQMNTGETINNQGVPTGEIDGEKVDGALFELYDVSNRYQELTSWYYYYYLWDIAPALIAKKNSSERVTPEDALVQIQYEIITRQLWLSNATAFPLTGSAINGHAETGVTYLDVANFKTGSEAGKVYAILQRDSASSGILYYQQPLVVALPFYQDDIEQDVVYLYPKGITEGIRKSVIPNTDLGDIDTTKDGLVDSQFVTRNFGEALDYVVELPIPKDIGTSGKFNELRMTDTLALGLDDLGIQSLKIGSGAELATHYQALPDTEPATFDAQGIKAWRDASGLHLTFELNSALIAQQGNMITLKTKARVNQALPINQNTATNVRYICDFTDEQATDFDVQAFSEGVIVGGMQLVNQDESQNVISGQRFKIKKGNVYLIQDEATLAISQTDDIAEATEFITDQTGVVTVKGLALGEDYYLLQSYSHEVYQPVTDGEIKVTTLNSTDEQTGAINRFKIIEQPLKVDMTEADKLTLLSVTNYHRGFLPQTGQMGALILILIALFGLGVSARMIYKNRHANQTGIEIE
ncbi:MAG: pilin N-terminal domain-containing protein [Streptococcaceae bacterium]|nr:pilin N-terminal domain-containing protein [Streptococcaceae bacterium]MCH4177405.1 pilin N-terminal domain-containing protein [Streptococcaceae bacterium]